MMGIYTYTHIFVQKSVGLGGLTVNRETVPTAAVHGLTVDRGRVSVWFGGFAGDRTDLRFHGWARSGGQP